VVRGGRVLARTPRVEAALALPGRPASVDFLLSARDMPPAPPQAAGPGRGLLE
jgi:hypothetical protein